MAPAQMTRHINPIGDYTVIIIIAFTNSGYRIMQYEEFTYVILVIIVLLVHCIIYYSTLL